MEIKIKKISLISIIWMLLATLCVFIPGILPWIATPVVLSAIIGVPGILFSVNLKIRSDKIIEYLLYSIGLGLCFLIFGGLAVNMVFPYLGIHHPLAQLPLIIFIDGSVLILIVRMYFFAKHSIVVRKMTWPSGPSLFFGIIPALFLLLSFIGAENLNNGRNGNVTLIMLFGIALYVLALMIKRRSIQSWVHVSALYFISLSLLLMYSLRSAHIVGWDINQEYEVFQATLQHLVWKMSYYPGLDYNACVSITILPTIFKELTHVSSEYIFKVVFQLLFAVTPVMVYVFAKRYLSNALAFLAAFLFVSQTWFFEQMPGLIRQETAFIFYILLLLVIFDKNIASRLRYILFYLFAAALVLSHYSTAYVWLGLLLGAFLLSYAFQIFSHSRDVKKHADTIKPIMIIIPFLLLVMWQVFITQTTTAVANFVTHGQKGGSASITATQSRAVASPSVNSKTPVANIVPAAPFSGPSTALSAGRIIKTLFFDSNPNTDQNIMLAEQKDIHIYDNQPGYMTYPNANATQFAPIAVNQNINVSPKLSHVESLFINIISRISKILFIDIFPLVGIGVLYREYQGSRDNEKYYFVILGIVAYGLIAGMVLIPYLQEYYNFTRLYLQMFPLIAVFAIMGGVALTKYLPRYRIMTLAFMAVLIFFSLTGAFDQLTGGQARLTLHQPPSTLDIFYIHDAEIAAVRWLAANRNVSTAIQSDGVADLRLQSYGNMTSSNSAIFPDTFEKGSYVYLDNLNITSGNAFIQYNNNMLVYLYPISFLNTHKNLIYNDGGSEIYR